MCFLTIDVLMHAFFFFLSVQLDVNSAFVARATAKMHTVVGVPATVNTSVLTASTTKPIVESNKVIS